MAGNDDPTRIDQAFVMTAWRNPMEEEQDLHGRRMHFLSQDDQDTG
jgi:hypothetical protein